MNQRAKTLFIVLPVLLGMAAAGYFLYMDYHTASAPKQSQAIQTAATVETREVIAEVTFANKNVKRKSGDGTLWENVEKSTKLYVKDSIRTGDDSYATIKFNDGNLIELNENSLIVLDKSTDKLTVDFKVGDIVSRGQAIGLQIKINDSIVQGDNADFKVTTGPGQNTDVLVEKGKATVTDKDKKKLDLDSSKKGTVDEKGRGEVKERAVLLKLPEPKAIIKTPLATIKQNFSWEVRKETITEERLELSRSEKFLEKSVQTFSSHQNTTADIKSGTTFWRVSWLEGDKRIFSESRKVTVESDKNIELLNPTHETSYDLEVGDNKLDFNWKSDLPSRDFLLEISRTKEFKDIAKSEKVSGTQIAIRDLKSGAYFWRVKGLGEKEKLTGESNAWSFTVKLALPSLPSLIEPIADFTLEESTPLKLSWTPTTMALSYKIFVSQDKEQKKISKTETVDGKLSEYLWKWKNVGDYYWSVQSLDEKQEPVGHSEVRHFIISPKKKVASILALSPKNKSEVLRDKKEPLDAVEFQWKPLKKMSQPYTFVIDKTSDFKEAVQKKDLKELKFSLRLKDPGFYFWKVTSGEDFSDVQSFELKINNSLPAPLLQEPLNRAEIVTVEPQKVTFQWKPVDGASGYFITVNKVDLQTEEKKTVFETSVTENQAQSPPLDEGDYVWSVSSVNKDEIRGLASKSRSFKINQEEELAAPQLKAPVVK